MNDPTPNFSTSFSQCICTCLHASWDPAGLRATEDIEDKLLEICGFMGSYADACKTTVMDQYDVIYR